MAFKPLTLDGQAAARRLLAKGTYPMHRCLEAVFSVFPFPKSDKPSAYTSARAQWARIPSARRRLRDRNMPPGALAFFDLAVEGTRDPRPGHICISLGGDRVATTDWPERGKVGEATIGAIEKKWNATYLGWADVIGGHNVTVGTDPDEIVGTPAGGALIRRAQVVVADKGLWFRAKPSLLGKKLRLLKKGTVVTTTGRVRGSWEEAIIDGVTGWLHSSFIFWRNRMVTAKKGLNLRTRPSTDRDSRVIATLADKTKVVVLGTKGKWREVSVGKLRGWVHSDYLK